MTERNSKEITTMAQEYYLTPLGLLPKEWQIKPVSEAFDICNHLRFPISETERAKIKGCYPYYGPTKIQDFINEYRINGKYALIGEDGDHFLKWKTHPMTLLVEGKFNVNNHAHIVQGTSNMTEWFYYYFNQRELTPYLTRQGAGRYKLTKEALSKLPCILPSYIEQGAIVKLLATWDKAIHSTEALITQRELRKKWLMQQLLTGKKRIKGFQDEWQYLRFNEIYSPIRRRAGTERFHILSVTKDGIVSQAEYFNKEIASDDTSQYLVIKKGDMVMSGLNFWMGSIDVLTEYEIGMVSPAYKTFEICNSQISADFMRHFVRSHIMLRALVGSSVTGASIVRRNMDKETLEEWSFHLPSKKEQEVISKVITNADTEITFLKSKLTLLFKQKKWLMQQLLTGKKRLKIKKS